jgi:hypothetical protein
MCRHVRPSSWAPVGIHVTLETQRHQKPSDDLHGEGSGERQSSAENAMSAAPSHSTEFPSWESRSLPSVMVRKSLPASGPILLVKAALPYASRISVSLIPPDRRGCPPGWMSGVILEWESGLEVP